MTFYAGPYSGTENGNCLIARRHGRVTGSNDNYISFAWQGTGEEKMLIAVNYSPDRNQCYIRLPFQDMGDKSWLFHDLIGSNTFEREGNELQEKGLYLDEPGWKIYVFSLNIIQGDPA